MSSAAKIAVGVGKPLMVSNANTLKETCFPDVSLPASGPSSYLGTITTRESRLDENRASRDLMALC
jgi:hypothetical protein